MQPIHKVDQRLHRDAHRGWAALFGLPFAVAGGYFILAGLEIVEQPSSARAPPEIIVAMGAVFTLVGLFLVSAGLRGEFRRLRAARIRRTHPGQPWLYEHRWSPGGVLDQPARRSLTALGRAVLIALFLVPFNWWAFWSGIGDWLVIGITSYFDLVAIALAATALYRLAAGAKFGRSQLAFTRYPMFHGEPIVVALSPNRGVPLAVTLRFVEERMVTTTRNRKRYEAMVLWQARHDFEAAPDAPVVEMAMPLPDDRSLVNRLYAGSPGRYWELAVEAHHPGIDFHTTFPLPVYAPPSSDFARAPVKPLPPLRRRNPRRFELKIAAAAVLAIVAIVALAPTWFTDVAASASRSLRVHFALESAGDLGGDTMDLARAADGAVWVATTLAVHRFPPGEPDASALVAERPAGRDDLFFQRLRVTDRGVVWVGGWGGEVLRVDDGEIRELSPIEDRPAETVADLAVFRGDLYVAAGGAWRYPAGAAPAVAVEALPGRRSQVLTADGDRALYAGVGQELWRLGDDGWRRIWRSRGNKEYLGAISLDRDRILVGTHGGLYTLDSKGNQLAHVLAGRDVRDIALDGARVWVMTPKRGLFHGSPSQGSTWRGLDASDGLPDRRLMAIAADGQGGLWLSFFSAGVVHARIETLAPLLESREESIDATSVRR